MKQAHLRIVRLILAFLFFMSLGFLFIDFREVLPENLYKGITFLQFMPSLIKFFTTFSLVSAGFIMVIVLTVLFGRVYCSAICPLGILQDFISRLGKKLRRKKHRYRYGRPKNYWRYSFLAIPLLVLLAGRSLVGINLLDPYSIFGRIFSDFGQPAYIWINNRLAGLLESMNIYFLYPKDIHFARVAAYGLPFILLVVVSWLSLRHGRLYCNTVCPVGTLLGLVSRVSFFRIRMIEDSCTKCAKCAFACKASCIDVKNLEIDFSRCVACYNCIEVCPENAIRYLRAQTVSPSGTVKAFTPAKPSSQAATKVEFSGNRREAINRMLGLGLALGFLNTLFNTRKLLAFADEPSGEIENKIPTEIEPVKNFPVSPPGSLGIRHFTKRCTACHLCVSACPTGVLKPSLGEYGWSGIMQPHMDYSSNYCNFDCIKCAEVCPTGAILSLTQETKKTTQLGQVQLILENCVVYAENTACGSCSEHCPTQAVTMVDYKDGLTIPEIKPEICIGCGACEYACPVSPFKAIYVDGHETHKVAQEPEIEELEKTEMEDFPF